jgi:hypothetical protein
MSAPIINRTAVIVEVKEPYMQWADALDDGGPRARDHPRRNLVSVYLIEEEEDPEDALKRHWDWIFEEKLVSWHRVPEDWPQQRTNKMFHEWFDVRLVELVFDLADAPMIHEEF